MFFCEVAVREQPLVTTIPDGDVLLPTDPESLRPGDCLRQETVSIHKSSTSVSCIDSPDVGGFGRAAQAAWLLDQVFKTLGILSLHSRLVRLQSLDAMIQNFLGLLIQQCSANERPTSFCQPIAITIRLVHLRELLLSIYADCLSKERCSSCTHISPDRPCLSLTRIIHYLRTGGSDHPKCWTL
jgi:hypothetical protein